MRKFLEDVKLVAGLGLALILFIIFVPIGFIFAPRSTYRMLFGVRVEFLSPYKEDTKAYINATDMLPLTSSNGTYFTGDDNMYNAFTIYRDRDKALYKLDVIEERKKPFHLRRSWLMGDDYEDI